MEGGGAWSSLLSHSGVSVKLCSSQAHMCVSEPVPSQSLCSSQPRLASPLSSLSDGRCTAAFLFSLRIIVE